MFEITEKEQFQVRIFGGKRETLGISAARFQFTQTRDKTLSSFFRNLNHEVSWKPIEPNVILLNFNHLMGPSLLTQPQFIVICRNLSLFTPR